MIETINNPAFNRYMAIEELYFRIGVREGKLEEIQATEEYQAFERMLLGMAGGTPENG